MYQITRQAITCRVAVLPSENFRLEDCPASSRAVKGDMADKFFLMFCNNIPSPIM